MEDKKVKDTSSGVNKPIKETKSDKINKICFQNMFVTKTKTCLDLTCIWQQNTVTYTVTR